MTLLMLAVLIFFKSESMRMRIEKKVTNTFARRYYFILTSLRVIGLCMLPPRTIQPTFRIVQTCILMYRGKAIYSNVDQGRK